MKLSLIDKKRLKELDILFFKYANWIGSMTDVEKKERDALNNKFYHNMCSKPGCNYHGKENETICPTHNRKLYKLIDGN